MIASLKAQFLDLIRLEFGFARGEHLLMSAILTPGPQQNKSKLLDQVRDVIRLKRVFADSGRFLTKDTTKKGFSPVGGLAELGSLRDALLHINKSA